jgi:UDPglucose 6-dehydrogenase
MRVAVIGTGYVGLVTGVVLADLGNDVICVDNDQKKLARLRAGKPTIYEPGLEELMQRAIQNGFLSFSDSIKDSVEASEVIFIAVGTPPDADGAPDMQYVLAVAREIAMGVNGDKVIVNKSTVPVGTGKKVYDTIVEHGAPAGSVEIVSNPEFLREGSAIRDTLEPDRIVIGASSEKGAEKLRELYAPLNKPFVITDIASAELIKYGANSFLAMKISFINAMSRLCEITGADVGDVAQGMGMDARIGPQFLQAGLGYGGSCFPKDVMALIKISEKLDYRFRLLEEVARINDEQPLRFLDRLEKELGGFEGKLIAILGLAFKPNTDDIRDAMSLKLIEGILAKGGRVRGIDPVAGELVKEKIPAIELETSVYEIGQDADALVLVTEWNEFRELDLARLGEKMKRKLLFDGRRAYSPAVAQRAGFEYFTIGS